MRNLFTASTAFIDSIRNSHLGYSITFAPPATLDGAPLNRAARRAARFGRDPFTAREMRERRLVARVARESRGARRELARLRASEAK